MRNPVTNKWKRRSLLWALVGLMSCASVTGYYSKQKARPVGYRGVVREGQRPLKRPSNLRRKRLAPQALGATNVVMNSDFRAAGVGALRGVGSGEIIVTGVSGVVTGATLYWSGPTNSTDPTVNATVDFAGNDVTGTNIGFADSLCWGLLNSQAYQADVTSLVSGNGSYSLANFVKPDAEINGASLIVFFDDGNSSNNRDIYLVQGIDSNFDADSSWDATISGINYASGSANLQFHVSDGQFSFDDAVTVNGSVLPVAPPDQVFSGDSVPLSTGCCGPPIAAEENSGGLWDIKSFDITSLLSLGTNDLNVRTGLFNDCLGLVVLIADVQSTSVSGICLQDDSSGSILQINIGTGGYLFTNCSGFTLGGTGSVVIKGGVITLKHNASDRRILAKISTGPNKGTAAIQVLSQGITFTITDRNTADNSCVCN